MKGSGELCGTEVPQTPSGGLETSPPKENNI